jgi:hypothetical protein
MRVIHRTKGTSHKLQLMNDRVPFNSIVGANYSDAEYSAQLSVSRIA